SFIAGQLVRDAQVHADGSRDLYLSNIQNQSYTSEHDVYNTAGIITATTRTHADGSLAYAYNLATDGTKTSDYYDASGNLTSDTVVHADGSSDTQSFIAGQLVRDAQVHADGSRDVYLSNIQNQNYTSEHDFINTAGILTATTRTHADGSLAYAYNLAADGTKTSDYYDASGNLTSDTVVHADGSRDVYLSNIQNQSYTSEHDVYNTAGIITATTRTHADGSLAYAYSLAADGTKTSDSYDASGNLTTESVVHADGSSDLYLSNIQNQSYTSEHDVYNTAGIITATTRTHADGSLA